MRIGMLSLFLLIAFITEAQTIDVTHYLFSIELSDKSDSINATAAITFVNRTGSKQATLDLTSTDKKRKGMHVEKVSLGSTEAAPLPFDHSGDKLTITIPSQNNGAAQTLYIRYGGIPADGLIISKNKYGDRTFFADNWPNRAHQWIPCIDQLNDKATFEFYVTVPDHYQVISNGIYKLDKEDILRNQSLMALNKMCWHWKEDIALPTKVMVIGVAKFATKTFDDSPKDIPVSAWVYPQDSTKGFYDYHLATDIVKFFSRYIAPFPYNKLANVQSKTIFGGMENASCIFYAEDLITGTGAMEETIAHEIAHQWFGDMASEKSFAHLWLSEGFATYFTDLYFENKYGKEAAVKRLKQERNEAITFANASTHAIVDTTSNLMSLLNANSYQKGAWVLHMLRNEVGDAAFHKTIQAYYNQYKGGNADTRDFEAVAEQVSGKDLKWFFDQWLYKSGVPKLSFKQIKTAKGIELIITQLQNRLFKISLPVSIETASAKEKILHLTLTERTTSTLLTKDDKVKLKIDPDCTLLFEEMK